LKESSIPSLGAGKVPRMKSCCKHTAHRFKESLKQSVAWLEALGWTRLASLLALSLVQFFPFVWAQGPFLLRVFSSYTYIYNCFPFKKACIYSISSVFISIQEY